MTRFFTLVFAAIGLVLAASTTVPAGAKQEQGTLTIMDGSGKEHLLKMWKITIGTKHLSWLAPAPAEEKVQTKGKGKEMGKVKKGLPVAGPEALEFNEGDKPPPPIKKRVLAYIPLSSIRAIEYGVKKDMMVVRVAKSEKEAEDELLYGLCGFIGINTLAIDATTDLGELGSATVRFQYGVGRGLKSIRFPSPQPLEPVPEGRGATIKQPGKGQPSFTVTDLQALYVVSGGLERTMPTLFFKDTIKLDLAKVQKLTKPGAGSIDFDVTLASGQQSPLALIERPKAPDGKSDMLLEGLVGRFSGGYRFFPMATVGELEFEGKGK